MAHLTWDKLGDWLESQGFTKRELAKASGVGYLTTLKVLNGKIQPSPKTAQSLAKGVAVLKAMDRAVVNETGPYRLTFFHGKKVYLENLETKMHGLFWPGSDRTITGVRIRENACEIMNAAELLRYLGLYGQRNSKPGTQIYLASVRGVLDPIEAKHILARIGPGATTISWISVPPAVLAEIASNY